MAYDCWIPAIKDAVLAIAAIIGSVVAILGLNTWRRQLYGQSEYDLAKRILKSVYLFREVITNARHPFMQYSATPDLPKEKLDQLSNEEKEWYAKAQAFESRWEPVAKARAELDANVLESEVFWGNQVKDKAACLRELHAELLVAIEEHLKRTNPKNPDKSYGGEDLKRNRAIIYGRIDRTKDSFLDKLLTAVEAIEAILKPFIKKGKKFEKKKV